MEWEKEIKQETLPLKIDFENIITWLIKDSSLIYEFWLGFMSNFTNPTPLWMVVLARLHVYGGIHTLPPSGFEPMTSKEETHVLNHMSTAREYCCSSHTSSIIQEQTKCQMFICQVQVIHQWETYQSLKIVPASKLQIRAYNRLLLNNEQNFPNAGNYRTVQTSSKKLINSASISALKLLKKVVTLTVLIGSLNFYFASNWFKMQSRSFKSQNVAIWIRK